MKTTEDAKLINKHGTLVYVAGHRVDGLIATGDFKRATEKDEKVAKKKAKKAFVDPANGEDSEAVKQLNGMKKDDLLSLALDQGIEVSKEMKKEEIVNAVIEATA